MPSIRRAEALLLESDHAEKLEFHVGRKCGPTTSACTQQRAFALLHGGAWPGCFPDALAARRMLQRARRRRRHRLGAVRDPPQMRLSCERATAYHRPDNGGGVPHGRCWALLL